MIKGFTNKALVIYPLPDDYFGRGRSYEGHLNTAARKLRDYLRMCGISYDCFATDDIARNTKESPDRWVLTLGSGDMHFVSTNCEGMDLDFSQGVKYPDMYKESLQKYPNVKGASIDNRFESILKRDAMVRRKILKDYKLVFIFNQPKSPAMRITPKADSGVLNILIDNTNFLAQCYMSDMSVSPVDILGIPNGNAPAYEWEVDKSV